jgi:hypothetical protein
MAAFSAPSAHLASSVMRAENSASASCVQSGQWM